MSFIDIAILSWVETRVYLQNKYIFIGKGFAIERKALLFENPAVSGAFFLKSQLFTKRCSGSLAGLRPSERR